MHSIMKIKSQSEIKHFKNTEKKITKSLKTCHWNLELCGSLLLSASNDI